MKRVAQPLLLLALSSTLAWLLWRPALQAAPAALATGTALRSATAVREFPSSLGRIRVETLVRGLEHPWALAFLPDGRLLVTERPGRLRLVTLPSADSVVLPGVPAVFAEGQGGLLDIALAPDFAKTQDLYFCFAEPRSGGNGTALARAHLAGSGAAASLAGVQVIFRQQPAIDSRQHFGCRIVFARDHTLWLTLGERGSARDEAQNLASHLGKVVRLTADGRVPADNPFLQRQGAAPELWSLGHQIGRAHV
jgi:glucose/arabinose dehydrogenase